jgi:citrate:succinate antiporter
MGGLSPTFTIFALVTVYFCSHYMFASLTAHTSAMMPVMLAVGLEGSNVWMTSIQMANRQPGN